jgi:prepilin-type N-terminal cleavage/methylation domain-containing protein
LNRKGFTLVELLVASSLFLLATLTFSYLLKTGISSVESAARLKQATYTLQSRAEEIRALSFSDLPSLDGTTFAQGRGNISVTPALADLVKIELELEWDPNKIPLRISTLRSNY